MIEYTKQERQDLINYRMVYEKLTKILKEINSDLQKETGGEKRAENYW